MVPHRLRRAIKWQPACWHLIGFAGIRQEAIGARSDGAAVANNWQDVALWAAAIDRIADRR